MKSKLLAFIIAGMLGMAFLSIVKADDTPIVLAPHADIDINDDGDFAGVASSGNGSLSNPYILDNMDFSGGSFGIRISGAILSNFTIRNCTFDSASAYALQLGGIYGYFNITNCSFNHCFIGIVVSNHNSGIVSYTTHYNTTLDAIDILAGENVVVCHNTIYDGSLTIDTSDYCMLYDNYIYLNGTHYLYNDGTGNLWNATYPIGGNYYNDYESYDNYSGAGQNISGSDGIGDDVYPIIGGSSGVVDYYPINLDPLVAPPIPPDDNETGETNLTAIGDIIFDMIPVIFIILFIVLIVTQMTKIYKRK